MHILFFPDRDREDEKREILREVESQRRQLEVGVLAEMPLYYLCSVDYSDRREIASGMADGSGIAMNEL